VSTENAHAFKTILHVDLMAPVLHAQEEQHVMAVLVNASAPIWILPVVPEIHVLIVVCYLHLKSVIMVHVHAFKIILRVDLMAPVLHAQEEQHVMALLANAYALIWILPVVPEIHVLIALHYLHLKSVIMVHVHAFKIIHHVEPQVVV
jgi:hypothetical protein